MKSRTLAVNSFWSLTSHVLSRGSLIVASVILARMLPTAGFAAYSYFQMTAAMLATYAALGLGVTASRYFAEAGHERPGAPPAPLGTLWTLSVAVSVAAFVVVLLVPYRLLSAGLDMPHWLLALGVASIALGVIPAGAILGAERYRDASVIAAASGAIMVTAAWWAGSNQAPVLAMAAIIVSTLLQAAGQFVIAGRAVGWERMFTGLGFARHDLSRVYGFAGPMMAVSLMAGSATWLVGRIILRGSEGEHAFALYSIGMQWFSLALLLPGVISRVALPRMVQMAASAGAEARALVRQATAYASGTGVVIAALGVVLGPWLLTAYGDVYAAGRWFIAMFLIAGVINAPITTLGNAIIVHDGQRIWMYVTAAWFVVLLLVAMAAVSAGLGAWTGAIAQSVSNGLQLVVTVFLCRREGLI